MKVNFSYKIKVKNDFSLQKRSRNTNGESNYENVTELSQMPSFRYMVNFGAKSDSLETLFGAYSGGKGMPVTYENALQQMTKEERENIKDVYANYKSIYADMENCHTVEELKSKYPQEFSKLQSAFSKKDSKGSFLTQLNEWANLIKDGGEYLFPETKDNDFSVYLAKKVYLEAKTKKEIQEDFIKDINPLLSNEEVKSLGSARRKADSELIPENVYTQLGLRSDIGANGFRNSLSRSRQEYIDKYGSVYKSKRVATFNKTVEEITGAKKVEESVAPKKNSTNYEKYQYAMFYVWNDSMDLRHALSDFLIDHQQDNELLKPDFMGINNKTKTEDEKRKNQRNLMSMFWQNNPELTTDFAEKCKEAFEVVEKAIDNGTFGDLKKSIDAKREQVYEILKQEKEAKEQQIAEQKRLRELELAEQARLQQIAAAKKARVDNLKRQVDKFLKEMTNFTPIPKNQYYGISKQLQARMENTEGLSRDELTAIADKGYKAVTQKAVTAIRESGWVIINPIKEKLIKSAYIDILTQYPQYRQKEDFQITKVILESDLERGMGVFEGGVLTPYLCYMINHNTTEFSKQDKKKILEKFYQKCINSETYKKNCINKTRENLVEKLTQYLKTDISPKEVLNTYSRIFANTPLILEEPTK